MKKIIIVVVLTLIAGLFFKYLKADNIMAKKTEITGKEERQRVAIDIAVREVVKLERFQRWKAKGLKYEISAREGNPVSIWAVDFDTPHLTDQNINITVDIAAQKVISVDVHME